MTTPDTQTHDPGTMDYPVRQVAMQEAIALARAAGVPLEERQATGVPLALLKTVHCRRYIKRLSASIERHPSRAWTMPDAPIVAGTWMAALHAAGAADLATQYLAAGGPCRRAFLAVRPPGHHASADRAQGYCYLNTAALAARLLQDRGIATRVAILDVDAHHGNGTQALLPRLGETVYASVHGAGYPGTGFADEPPRCWNRTLSGDGGGEAWLAALDAVATGLVSTRPDAVVISFGTDALRYDPVGDLGLTQEDLDTGVCRALERMAGIPVISVMEGGYHLGNLTQAVRRHLHTLATK
ncbi:MAG: histone deacetylase [Planctomycetes bacterium]|nr:histone deacetylase [Planctomycetota bacterium]